MLTWNEEPACVCAQQCVIISDSIYNAAADQVIYKYHASFCKVFVYADLEGVACVSCDLSHACGCLQPLMRCSVDLGCQDVMMKSVAVMSERPACVCAQQCVIISDRPFVPAAATKRFSVVAPLVGSPCT